LKIKRKKKKKRKMKMKKLLILNRFKQYRVLSVENMAGKGEVDLLE